MSAILDFTISHWISMTGVLIALLVGFYTIRSFYLARRIGNRDSGSSNEINQISEGANAPNINTKGNVTISYGKNDDE